jgi:hypothetical protein
MGGFGRDFRPFIHGNGLDPENTCCAQRGRTRRFALSVG